MEPYDIQNLVSGLTDLELAVLLALVCQGHCVIETPRVNIDNVSGEIALICENKFGLSFTILNCSPSTTLEEFSENIIAPDLQRGRSPHAGSIANSSQSENYLDERKIVNVVVAKNFNHVSSEIQVKALELINSKRIFTRASFHTTQKTFLFVPVLVSDEGTRLDVPLNKHLNEAFLFSHFHEIGAGLPNLEEDNDWLSDDQVSLPSVVRKSQLYNNENINDNSLYISEQVISQLRQVAQGVAISAEVNGYLHNIISFLRLHRAVAGGVSVKATKYFALVAKCLASLHGVNYLTPSVVCLAAKKVYRHRIKVARVEDDRSLQYGSQLEAVKVLFEGLDSDQIINSVIEGVEPPL